jgi:hypothetical protein
VEMDGVRARLRRGRVVMEVQEEERAGEVDREITGGAACVGWPGRERSSRPWGLRSPDRAGCVALSRWSSWATERDGSGNGPRNRFPGPSRWWMSITRASSLRG